jgi:hypothetical protein
MMTGGKKRYNAPDRKESTCYVMPSSLCPAVKPPDELQRAQVQPVDRSPSELLSQTDTEAQLLFHLPHLKG